MIWYCMFAGVWSAIFAACKRISRHIHAAFAFAIFFAARKAVKICAFVSSHNWFAWFVVHSLERAFSGLEPIATELVGRIRKLGCAVPGDEMLVTAVEEIFCYVAASLAT